jgi:hypothetical protein
LWEIGRVAFQFIPEWWGLHAPFAFNPWTGSNSLLMVNVPFKKNGFKGYKERVLLEIGNVVTFQDRELIKEEQESSNAFLLHHLQSMDVAKCRRS